MFPHAYRSRLALLGLGWLVTAASATPAPDKPSVPAPLQAAPAVPVPGQPQDGQTSVAPGCGTTGAAREVSSPAVVEAPRAPPPAPSAFNGSWTGRDWAPIVAAGFAGTGGILAFFAAIRSTDLAQRANRAALAQKANETELDAIERKLDDFLGPYLQLSHTNRLLQRNLRERQPDPEAFRTMILLLDPAWRDRLSIGDRTLVEEIIKIDGQLELLIRRSAGLVDATIQPYLARASAHFRMIRLAFKGKLDNDPDRYAKYVYPRSLDAVLNLEVARLQGRRDRILASPDVAYSPPSPLAIPPDLALEA